jgi:guanyl-specific ribonuclease Sa
VGALEEYLNDPNFEQNRIEYKANRDAADKSLKNGRSVAKKADQGEPFDPSHQYDHPRSTAYASTSTIHLNGTGNRSPRRIVCEGDPESRNDQGLDGLL